jgi:hypothetical protein
MISMTEKIKTQPYMKTTSDLQMLFHMYLRTAKKQANMVPPLMTKTAASVRYHGTSCGSTALLILFFFIVTNPSSWYFMAMHPPMYVAGIPTTNHRHRPEISVEKSNSSCDH